MWIEGPVEDAMRPCLPRLDLGDLSCLAWLSVASLCFASSFLYALIWGAFAIVLAWQAFNSVPWRRNLPYLDSELVFVLRRAM